MFDMFAMEPHPPPLKCLTLHDIHGLHGVLMFPAYKHLYKSASFRPGTAPAPRPASRLARQKPFHGCLCRHSGGKRFCRDILGRTRHSTSFNTLPKRRQGHRSSFAWVSLLVFLSALRAGPSSKPWDSKELKDNGSTWQRLDSGVSDSTRPHVIPRCAKP